MKKSYWMIRIVRIVAVLFILLGCLVIFIYSPFYSKMMLRILNAMVPVEVNQVAAQSQKMAALSDEDTLEPGSDLWIARQAYLKVMESAIKSSKFDDLNILQARYKILQNMIEKEQKDEKNKQIQPQIPLLTKQTEGEVVDDPSQQVKDLLNLNSKENKALMEQYIEFLKTHEIKKQEVAEKQGDRQIFEDIAYLHDQKDHINKPNSQSKPYAIVVLGGGLTLDKNGKDIVINDYTRLRLQKTLEVEQQYKLPIVLSGVEAPYMQTWLKQYHVDAKLLEDRSMNTCENSRFSSLLLQKKGGAPTVILITDPYHMPRTRRLFALNGIATLPIDAPMPTSLTQWQPSEQNYHHSRRANYEFLATIRDMLFGSGDCREVP